jgi:hypothetical protein
MESSAPKSKSLKIRDRAHPTLTTVSAKKRLKSLNIVSGGRLKPKPVLPVSFERKFYGVAREALRASIIAASRIDDSGRRQ